MEDASLTYAKAHKKELIQQILANKPLQADKTAVFMAGSPGAGKTESAQTLVALYPNLVAIDADHFRALFPGYNGSYSDQFQKGSSLLVDAALDAVLKQGHSFILDGTFATSKVIQNIQRSLKRNYDVWIYYIYQDPDVAWQFTQEREAKEGRYVPKERFINAYFASRKNLLKVKETFGDAVTINILLKNMQNQLTDVLTDIDNIELALPVTHTKEELEAKLS